MIARLVAWVLGLFRRGATIVQDAQEGPGAPLRLPGAPGEAVGPTAGARQPYPIPGVRPNGLECLACGAKLYFSYALCTRCDARAAAAPPGEWARTRQAEREARSLAALEQAGVVP